MKHWVAGIMTAALAAGTVWASSPPPLPVDSIISNSAWTIERSPGGVVFANAPAHPAGLEFAFACVRNRIVLALVHGDESQPTVKTVFATRKDRASLELRLTPHKKGYFADDGVLPLLALVRSGEPSITVTVGEKRPVTVSLTGALDTTAKALSGCGGTGNSPVPNAPPSAN